MDKLISGIREFSKTGYEENKSLFQELANGQSPEALLITCADSRIDPNMITQTKPGDLFICRNAGNIVPPHGPYTGGITASIEYAVAVLNVPHIIVCGHTDCGAMKGAMNPDSLKSLPHVSNWLGNCSAALAKIKARHGEVKPDMLKELTEENIILQMKHLETHPSVSAKLATGDIELHGWVYNIGEGTVSCYDRDTGKFVSVEDRYEHLLKHQKTA